MGRGGPEAGGDREHGWPVDLTIWGLNMRDSPVGKGEWNAEKVENRENLKRFRDAPEMDARPAAASGGRRCCRTETNETQQREENYIEKLY